jgi:NADH pyrophosphatase NudC (nudix superfamily)
MFYPSAKAVVYDPHNPEMLLLAMRNGHYEPAGGKLNISFVGKKAESFEECAIREAHEELGAEIVIKNYIGSYNFFWTINVNCMSACVVFSAVLIKLDDNFSENKDCEEFPVKPVWVHAQDIVNGNISIDRQFIGLESLMKRFASVHLNSIRKLC